MTISSTELFMVPPGSAYGCGLGPKRKFMLRLQCTGGVFEMDEGDWNKARHCQWWYDTAMGQPVNARGILFTDYVGIHGVRRSEGVEKFNFSRSTFN